MFASSLKAGSTIETRRPLPSGAIAAAMIEPAALDPRRSTPPSSRPTTSAGLYGEQIDEDVAYRIGRGFAAGAGRHVRARAPGDLRLALGRDMRLHRPGAVRALRRRACATRARRCSTSGWWAPRCSTGRSARAELDGGLMCTASHNPKAYTGAKLVGRGALALSGRRGHRRAARDRDRRASRARPPTRPGELRDRGRRRAVPRRRARRSSTRPRCEPMKVVLDGGNGMAGPDVRADPRHAADRAGADLLGARRRVPRPRAQPAAGGEPPLHHRQGARPRAPTSASPGTATPTAASSSTTRGAFVDGDFLTALLAAVDPREGAGRGDPLRRARLARRARPGRGRRRQRPREPRGPRVLQDPHARRGRRVRRRGVGPLLLPRLLLRRLGHAARAADPRAAVGKRGSTHDASCSTPLRERYFISGEINSEVADQEAKMDEIKERYSDGEITELDGVSVDYEDWHFNVRPSNTEPLLRLNLESLRLPRAHGGEARRGAGADPRVSGRTRSPRPPRRASTGWPSPPRSRSGG